MPRALLITNPAAARIEAQSVTAVRETLRGAGWAIEVAATGAPGDARRLAERGRAEGFEALLCYGGDGTAMQVAAALAGTGVPLGLIPGGTGNLLAGNLRLPRRPVPAARTILKAKPLAIDLGTVQRSDGQHYFAVCCGAGFDAALMARTDSASKRRWRMAAYAREALLALPRVVSEPHRIIVDGVAHEHDASMVLVCNCGELVPPLLRLHPNIRPNDGILDVVTLRAKGAWQSATAFFELLFAGLIPRNQVWFGRGRSVRIEVTSPARVPTQLDGELAGETPLEAQVVPGALMVFVDPDTVPGGMDGHG